MTSSTYKELKINRYQYGLLLNLLIAERNEMIKQNKDIAEINQVIMKLIEARERKKSIFDREDL